MRAVLFEIVMCCLLATGLAAAQFNFIEAFLRGGTNDKWREAWLKITELMSNTNGVQDQLLARMSNKQCATHIKEYAQAIKETKYWAITMLDATTKVEDSVLFGLSTHLGNYDQCLSVKDVRTSGGTFDGQHCIVDLCNSTSGRCKHSILDGAAQFTEMENSTDHLAGNEKLPDMMPGIEKLFHKVKMGMAICIPSSCHPVDLEMLFSSVLDHFNIHMTVNVDEKFCNASQQLPLDSVDYFAIAVLSFFLSLTIFSTVYDLLTRNDVDRNQLITAFSAYSNGLRLLEVSTSRDGLYMLHGLRFLSIAWVMMGHRISFVAEEPLLNARDALDFLKDDFNLWISCALYAVETFFVLSGALLSYVFLRQSIESKSFPWFSFYLHRYLRLTPMLAMTTLLEASLLDNVASGPVWRSFTQHRCWDSWWHNLLFIRNMNMPSRCMFQAWYVAADMQLYCVSPLLLIPLWKRPRAGLLILLGSIVLSTLVAFANSYFQDLSTSLSVNVSQEQFDNSILLQYYPAYLRCASWLLGIGLGYFLRQLQTGKNLYHLKRWKVILLWTITTGLLVFPCLAARSILQTQHAHDALEAAMFNSVHRTSWSLGICLMIFLCVKGHGGVINWFLSLGAWQPLSRLTFAMYLTHTLVQMSLVKSLKSTTYLSNYHLIPGLLADLVLTIMISIPLSIMIESPVLALEKRLLLRQKR